MAKQNKLQMPQNGGLKWSQEYIFFQKLLDNGKCQDTYDGGLRAFTMADNIAMCSLAGFKITRQHKPNWDMLFGLRLG